MCGDVPLTNTPCSFGSPQFLGLGFLSFVTIILVEIFGSPFMRNASIIIGLIVGMIVAGATGYVDSSNITSAPAITFLWVKRFKLRVYGPAVLPGLAVYIALAMEAIGEWVGVAQPGGKNEEHEREEEQQQEEDNDDDDDDDDDDDKAVHSWQIGWQYHRLERGLQSGSRRGEWLVRGAWITHMSIPADTRLQPEFDSRIQGGVLADGIAGFLSGLFTVTPMRWVEIEIEIPRSPL
jgi:xanthine/uracil permease